MNLESKQKRARELALEILEEVFEEGAYSNIALNKALKQSALSSADKSLVTELVYGTVARKITLEWQLAHWVEDRDKLDAWLYILLELSLYQMLYLDKIPQHAVVNEAVEIAKGRKRGSEKYVNLTLQDMMKMANIMQEHTTKAMATETLLTHNLENLTDDELKEYDAKDRYEKAYKNM